eukprot:1702990-Prymnesium_polylepis.1
MESCGAPRESFIRSGVTRPLTTTPTGAEPRGTRKRASRSRALTSRLRCRRHLQHCGRRRPHLHTGAWAMESCGWRRESFIRRGVKTPLTTTPP